MKRLQKLLIMAGGYLILLFFWSCGGGSTPGKVIDTPTAGRITLGAEDSYHLLTEAEIYTFESLYRNASIDTVFAPELDLLDAFMEDSLQLIMISRKLTEDEDAYLRSRQIIAKTTRVALDAAVFIVNRNNPDTNIAYDHLRDIFLGKITTWKQINPSSGLGDIKVIFDHYKSGNTRYFREKFGVDSLPPSCFAVNRNAEVIRFVENNPGAMGVIGVNWISDPQDTVSNSFLSRIKVVAVSNEGNTGASANYYRPYQAYIAEGLYPFTREVFMINRQTYSGLAYGLTAFIAGEKGQLIILRSGMVPATMPVRLVEVRN